MLKVREHAPLSVYRKRYGFMAKTRESIMREQTSSDIEAPLNNGNLRNGQGNGNGKINGEYGYSEQNIQILEGLEAVRVRPGMYIGATDQRGLHHLIQEVVDNSIDEVMAGIPATPPPVLHPTRSRLTTDNSRVPPAAAHRPEPGPPTHVLSS